MSHSLLPSHGPDLTPRSLGLSVQSQGEYSYCWDNHFTLLLSDLMAHSNHVRLSPWAVLRALGFFLKGSPSS
jgi:hypothetical protein